MKRTLFYTAAALLFSVTACDSNTGENQTGEAVQSEDLHLKHTDAEQMSREEHIKLVKADEVQSFSNLPEKAQINTSSLTEQYLQMKEALVDSNPQQVSAAASTMLQSLKAWDGNDLDAEPKDFYQTRSASMRDELQHMVDNKELEKQRDHFARLSKSMTELVSAFDSGQNSLYYQYCPMAFDNKGAYWLSNSKEIRNPFHPEEMLTCGRVAREL